MPGPGTTYSKPGPTYGTATFASVFGGLDPNGTWNLFGRDFIVHDGGSFAGGWSLTVSAVPEPSAFVLGTLASTIAGVAYTIRRRWDAADQPALAAVRSAANRR